MLRITKAEENPSSATLKLEGRIAADWASLLGEECLRCTREKRNVTLDFTEVIFVDRRGAEALKRIASKDVRIINRPDLIRELLEEGEAGGKSRKRKKL